MKLKFIVSVICCALVLSNCGDDQKTPTCADGIQNQNEADIDCGGPCVSCSGASDGVWTSNPVAPLLEAFADSIVAHFNTDNTYQMAYWQEGSATIYSGTCVRVPSGVNDIFTIQMDQTSPNTAKLSGIYKVLENEGRLTLEIIQTTPSIGATPPLATDGFGSTKFNGVPLGNKNVQEFAR